MASKNISSEVIRILLIGTTGQGKSTTANSLVGQEGLFEESRLSKSETKTCSGSWECNFLGRHVEVVDTPGIFDNLARTHSELIHSLLLTMPGFHAVAYVLKCGEKITDEFKKTQDLFFDWFGPGMEHFSFVILTWCSSVEMKDEYLFKNPQSKLTELIQRCGGRVSEIENKGPRRLKDSQIRKIFETVDAINAANGNRCFTNLTYQLAQSHFQNKFSRKQDWLDNIDNILPVNFVQSTIGNTVFISTENTDDETQYLPIVDATTNERSPSTPIMMSYNCSGKEQERKMQTNESSPLCLTEDRSQQMSLSRNGSLQHTHIYDIESGSAIEETGEFGLGSDILEEILVTRNVRRNRFRCAIL